MEKWIRYTLSACSVYSAFGSWVTIASRISDLGVDLVVLVSFTFALIYFFYKQYLNPNPSQFVITRASHVIQNAMIICCGVIETIEDQQFSYNNLLVLLFYWLCLWVLKKANSGGV